MKARIFSIFSLVVSIVLLLALLPGGARPSAAQGPEPPRSDEVLPDMLPQQGPYRTPEGLWVMPEGAHPTPQAASVSPQATGGPDDFGYTWDDSVPLNWIDATDGTDTGMSGSSYGQKVGPISLPFSFKYYENTYTNLYIAASGYLAFTDEGTWLGGPRVPSPRNPNNVIAPYATPLDLATSGPANRVYYKSGGTAPNRYFVVEWYQVVSEDETYTYEVILHENGDIVFQYQAMIYNGGYYCGIAGIEDSTGLDGLAYVDFCNQAPSNKAVRFYRPHPSARVSITPLYQGRFTRAGEAVAFQVTIRNTGYLGADTYDLTASSTWSVSLYAADGATPLTDTDSDGTVDTGSVAQGDTFTVTVKVQTPTMANVGDDNTATITVHSSLNTSKSKTATLQTAVPAPFAQVYRDDADDAMSLYLVQPAAQAVKKATSDWYYGNDMAVAAMPGGYAYFWTKFRWTSSVVGIREISEIEYTLLDRYGNTTRPVSKLTNHSGATVDTYDYDPAVAVAPDGRIGVLWQRKLWNSSTSQSNYNIWFAILDSSGSLAYGPVNQTNNNAWGTGSDYGVPWFWSPQIAATGDNRFVLAWQGEHEESDGWVDDIYYAVRNSDGSEVKANTKLTNDTPGASGHYRPALASLSANRAFLSWVSRQEGNDDIYYAVVASDGNLVKTATDLSVDETVVDWWNYDAVQLSDGKILAAWEAWGCFSDEWLPRIRFALLDTSYNRIGTPTCLGKTVADITGDTSVSVAADAAGHAILTWMDSDWNHRSNLYYALVDGSGNILTPPMIFRTSQATEPYIFTSYEGYGNTSYNYWQVFLPLVVRNR